VLAAWCGASARAQSRASDPSGPRDHACRASPGPLAQRMAPNNALGQPTAAAMRRRVEGAAGSPSSVRGRSPRRKRSSDGASDGARLSSSDGFGAGVQGASSVLRLRA